MRLGFELVSVRRRNSETTVVQGDVVSLNPSQSGLAKDLFGVQIVVCVCVVAEALEWLILSANDEDFSVSWD